MSASAAPQCSDAFRSRVGFSSQLRALLARWQSPAKALTPQRISAADLFSARFKGSIDEMIRSDAFRDDELYQANRSLWWEELEIPGRLSQSPLTRSLRTEGGRANDVRRMIYWPRGMIDAQTSLTGRASFFTDFDNYRVVVNQVRGSDGRWVDRSAEVVGKTAAGEFVPFLYEKIDGQWVLAETSLGEKTKDACVRCHSQASRPGVFTPVPFRIVQTPLQLEHLGYDHFQAEKMFATPAARPH